MLWEQVETSREEVTSWLRTNNARLDELHAHFSDPVIVQNALHKYKVSLVCNRRTG